MTDTLLRPLADAFMQVGVFVALMVAPFAYARHRWADQLDAALQRHRRLGPVTAAALTMPPGCGGAIMVMTVYARGGVTYGSAIAALVATMGDASWVLLAHDPWLTVQLKLALLAVGSLTGYAVDALGVQPQRRRPIDPGPPAAPAAPVVPALRPAPAGFLSVGMLPIALWVALGAGAGISVPVTFQLTDASDLYLVVGLVGTALAVVSFVSHRGRLADDDVASVRPATMAKALSHGVHEVAFVTVWVAVAYLAWSGVEHGLGFDGSQLPVWGLAGVIVGACIGLVPGCAVQIVFAGMFAAGGVPLPTLVANTISQDGDALLPLLAMGHRAAVLATVITTLPALAVGSSSCCSPDPRPTSTDLDRLPGGSTMSIRVPAHVHSHAATHLARPRAAPMHLSLSDRLQLTLALCCALTGTPWGLTMAVVVLGVLAARRSARRAVDRSVAARRGGARPAAARRSAPRGRPPAPGRRARP